MSSTPVTPKPTTPETQPIPSVLAKDWAWLVSHLVTVVITIVVVGGLVLASVYGVENIIAKHDAATATRDNAALAAVVEQNKELQTEAQNKDALLQQAITALSAANAQLSAQQKARDTQLTTQVQANATLSASAAADRLTQQTKAAPGEITASNNTVTLDLPMSRVLVNDLDTLPVVQADLADETTQLANETSIANAALADVTAEKAEIAGLNKQIADQTVACAAEVKAEKAKTRKAGIKGFFNGVGVMIAVILGHAIK